MWAALEFFLKVVNLIFLITIAHHRSRHFYVKEVGGMIGMERSLRSSVIKSYIYRYNSRDQTN